MFLLTYFTILNIWIKLYCRLISWFHLMLNDLITPIDAGKKWVNCIVFTKFWILVLYFCYLPFRSWWSGSVCWINPWSKICYWSIICPNGHRLFLYDQNSNGSWLLSSGINNIISFVLSNPKQDKIFVHIFRRSNFFRVNYSISEQTVHFSAKLNKPKRFLIEF